jgi:hypothetical protein
LKFERAENIRLPKACVCPRQDSQVHFWKSLDSASAITREMFNPRKSRRHSSTGEGNVSACNVFPAEGLDSGRELKWKEIAPLDCGLPWHINCSGLVHRIRVSVA